MLNVQQDDRLYVLRSRCEFLAYGFFFSSFVVQFVCCSAGFFWCVFCGFVWGLSMFFVIFPAQTGTATSSPNEKTPFQYIRALVKER
jgi:hypothetical protein